MKYSNPAVKNIILDLGGVIINLNENLVLEAFRTLGVYQIDDIYHWMLDNGKLDDLETGHLEEDEFIDLFTTFLDEPIDDQLFKQAWNAILLDIPAERINVLQALNNDYNVCLLSNTNQMHLDYIEEYVSEQYGLLSLGDLFLKVYYSHKMKMRKPNPAIFKTVMDEQFFLPEDTLFVDDNEENIEAARQLGLHTELVTTSNQLTDIFSYEISLEG